MQKIAVKPLVSMVDRQSRKRTSIAAPEKRSLEAYFAVQPRPSGEKIAAIAEKLNRQTLRPTIEINSTTPRPRPSRTSATGPAPRPARARWRRRLGGAGPRGAARAPRERRDRDRHRHARRQAGHTRNGAIALLHAVPLGCTERLRCQAAVARDRRELSPRRAL